MNIERPTQPTTPEKKGGEEKAELEQDLAELGENLDTLESSSPQRIQKIVEFIEKHELTILGGAAGSGGTWALGEAVYSGSFTRFAVGLGLGAAAGKGLSMLVRFSKNREQARQSLSAEDSKKE